MLAASGTGGNGNVDALTGIFPGRDPLELRQALDAHHGNMDRAVEYLLSPQSNVAGVRSVGAITDRDAPRTNIVYETGDEAADAERARQMVEDERLAQRLQVEEQMQYLEEDDTQQDAEQDPQNWGVPTSMADIQETVAPLVEKSKAVGRSVLNRVQTFYKDYLEDEPAYRRPPQSGFAAGPAEVPDTETSVLRGSARNDDIAESVSHRIGTEGARRRSSTSVPSKKD